MDNYIYLLSYIDIHPDNTMNLAPDNGHLFWAFFFVVVAKDSYIRNNFVFICEAGRHGMKLDYQDF